MSGTYELRFGSIDLSPSAQFGDVEIQVYGLKRGRPVPVVATVNSMLQDGGIERVDRHENRDQSIIIGLKGPDAGALAVMERDLFLEAQKLRNELAWTPPDGFGATTVFDVLWAELAPAEDDDWDMDELRGCRVYVLTVRAMPFGRADREVVDAALTSAATPVSEVIADGTSAADWTGKDTNGLPAAVTASEGTLQIEPSTSEVKSDGAGTFYVTRVDYIYTPASAVDFSATPYLTLDFKHITGGTSQMTEVEVYADGVRAPEASRQLRGDGFYHSTFLVADASVTLLRIRVWSSNYFTNDPPVALGLPHEIDNVIRTNQAPNASATGRQSLRTVAVSGSARTQASLAIQHATAGLGVTLVYTCPALGRGYQPDLRRWRTGGGAVTADETTVSGSYETIGADTTFNVPAAGLPKGSYVLMARVRTDVASGHLTRGVNWSASTKIGAATFGQQSGASAKFPLTTTAWSIVPVGVMTLPPTDVAPGSAAMVEVKLLDAGTGDPVELDEAWLFYLGDDSALTQVACGAGTPALGTVHNRLWLDTASLDRYEPSIWQGTQADRSDSFHAGDGIPAWGIHSFAPPQMNVFVVTTGAANPEISLRHFPRYHTHALAS